MKTSRFIILLHLDLLKQKAWPERGGACAVGSTVCHWIMTAFSFVRLVRNTACCMFDNLLALYFDSQSGSALLDFTRQDKSGMHTLLVSSLKSINCYETDC